MSDYDECPLCGIKGDLEGHDCKPKPITDYTELLEELTDPMKFTWGSRTKAANAIRTLQGQVKELETKLDHVPPNSGWHPYRTRPIG